MGTTMNSRHKNVSRYIDAQLQSGVWGPGERLPSEHELADRFDVSRETIRKAMSRLKDQGVLVGQRGRGTFVAVPTPPGRDAATFLYIGDTDAHFHREQFLSLVAEAQDHHQRMLCFNPRTSRKGWHNRLKSMLAEVDWVVVGDEVYSCVADFVNDMEANLLITGFQRAPTNRPAHHVLIDHTRAIEMAVGYLAGLGHQRIALLTSEEHTRCSNDSIPPMIERPYYSGFRAGLARYGLEAGGSVFVASSAPKDEAQAVEGLCRELQKPDPPTACVADSDFRARLLYKAAAEMGLRIPEDISVVGMNDTPWCAALMPELTSLNMGQQTVARLIVLLCEKGPTDEEIVTRVEPRLVERQSCGRIGRASRLHNHAPRTTNQERGTQNQKEGAPS